MCLHGGPHSQALASVAMTQLVLWTLKHAVQLTATALGRILLVHEATAGKSQFTGYISIQ